MQPRDTARKEPQHMSFVSVNSERNTTKKLCQVVSASLCNGKHFERKEKGKFAS